jgi:flagellar protein FliO/FliZ
VLELILRIGFSLLVVFGLMWGIAKLAKRPLVGRGGATISVIARQQLSRAASVAVIRLGDRALVLGVTESQVNLLTETDLAALEKQFAGPDPIRKPVELNGANPVTPVTPTRLNGSLLSPTTWRQTVDFLRERTARRR